MRGFLADVVGTRGENSMVVVAFFSAFTTMLLLPKMIFDYAPMTPVQWMFLVLTGLAAAGGQIGITNAYACAPAKEISVYDYAQVIFAAIWGIWIFDEIPDILSIIGYVIIISAGVIRWRYGLHKTKDENKETGDEEQK